ncbi:MAG: hypothetical protein HYW24_05220 [Candidatus Aenigmarchaeota archaeon]|nr:hypothetical protein [Candidatus Aenigmarchaeota archaeon]
MVYDLHQTSSALDYISINYDADSIKRGLHKNLNIREGSLPVFTTRGITYQGSKLRTLVGNIVGNLRGYMPGLEVAKTDYDDFEIDPRTQFPGVRTVATFTDNDLVNGKVDIRVTGPHNDGTFTPLIDVWLEGTKKCEQELFGHYTGLPNWRDLEKIIEISRQV